MRTQHFTTLAMIAMLAAVATSVNAADTFRGVVKDQNVNGIDNVITPDNSNTMGGRQWYIDIQESFDGSGTLAGSQAEIQIGYVPPVDTRNGGTRSIQGDLPAPLANQHGVWVGDGSYLVDGGQVTLSPTASPNAVATTPWRVVDDLGDDYLIEANATIPVGESATIAFAGDTANNTNGLIGGGQEFGQLALQVSRLSDTEVSWQVKWDTDEAPGNKSDADVLTAVAGGEVRMQLAWNEIMNTFDAWLNDTQLTSGTLGAPGMNVHHLAFQLSDGAALGGLIGAVPEPSSLVLLIVGLVGMLGYRNRK